MFDYAIEKPEGAPGRPRWVMTAVSAGVHLVAVGLAVSLPILYASENLPDPPTMMAFIVDTPPPPPSPAPAARPAEPASARTTPRVVETPVPQTPRAVAPVEAPAAIAPEAPLPAAPARPSIEAGFEGGVEGGVAGGVVGGAVGGIVRDAPAPPPPPPQGPVRVGGQIEAPQLAHRVNPVYPPVAQNAQIEGTVMLEATVGRDGRVQSVKALQGHTLLRDAATSAVRQWRYQPLLLNGEPVPFILTVTVSFTIPR